MHAKTTRSVVSTIAAATGLLIFAAPSAQAYDANIGWVTNSYFKASVSSGVGEYRNGDWVLNAPATNETAFAIDSTQTVFKVTKNGLSDTRKVIQVDCDIAFDSFYYLDDITNDVTSAIAALSLVTNEDQAVTNWMALKNGNEWVSLTGADAALGSYLTRIEVDYSAATPAVRYQVKKSGGSWTTLKEGATEWFSTSAALPVMSNVCFIGKATLTSIDSKLSTTAVAEANYQDFDTISEALAEAKSSDQAVELYQNAGLETKDLKGGLAGATYTIQSTSGKAFTLTQSDWTSADKTGVTATYENGLLVVSEVKNLVAKVVNGDTDVAYFTLTDALTAGAAADKTVFVITNFAENATLSGSKDVVLDLAEFTVSKGTEAAPVITVSDSKLFVYNGVIAGEGQAAISAASGANVYIDEVIATNSATAIAAAGGSTVVISNGLFAGSITASDDATKIALLGGYILAKSGDSFTYSDKIDATGGKFTGVAQAAASGVLAEGYKFSEFAVPYATNGYEIAYEVMTNVTPSGSSEVATKVWSVAEDSGEKSIGGVQITDDWMDKNTTSSSAADKQAELNETAGYTAKGGGTMKKWEAYVLGMTATETSAGPVVKGVQDSSGKITFKIVSPEAIRAKESGCDVKFSVQEFTNPELTEGAGTESAKVDYDKSVEITPNSTGVRYYKLKMHISTKK